MAVECGYTPQQVGELSFSQVELLAEAADRKRAKDALTTMTGLVAALRAFKFGADVGDSKMLEEYLETLRKDAGYAERH